MHGAGRRAHAKGKSGRQRRRANRSARTRSPHWVLLVLLPPVLSFVLSSVFLNRWEKQIDAANRSIAENGGPGVVHLTVELADLRAIERLALPARSASVAEREAKILDRKADLERADAAYRRTEDYPGERAAYERVLGDRARFYAAVDRVIAGVEGGRPPDAEAHAEVHATADVLAHSMRDLIKLNADQVVRANEVSGRLRARTVWLATARDALAFAFVVAGTFLGLRTSRREAALAEERRLLDQQRVADLDGFAGRVAHDLRDVLTSILMRASMAEKAETQEASREQLARIVGTSQRMGDLIDALLSFARAAGEAEAGARCEVEPVVRQVVADVQPLAAQAGAEIVVEPMRSTLVACDATVLSVVFANLVRNAVKYVGGGREGQRRVTVRERSVDACLRFEVEDTGPGLPPGAEARVFTPFVRLPEATGKPGIGLGLATVKRLVEANGGEVGVVSPPGAGACFWFTLPLPS